METVEIAGKKIGAGQSTYVIAEIGFLFQSFDPKNGHPGAKELIDSAVNCGVDAVKIQTFRGETWLSPTYTFNLENTGEGVNGRKLVSPYEISEEDHRLIFEYCRSKNVAIFSTPSHPTDVDLLERFNPDAHKVGSDDLTNLPLLQYIAQMNRPMIVSTGMANLDEVKKAMATILPINPKLILLHCVSDYPVRPQNANLRAITTLAHEFGVPVGWSDHAMGGDVSLAAVALGACVIEKHLNSDPKNVSPDAIHSATPAQLTTLIVDIRQNKLPPLDDPNILVMIGNGEKQPTEKTSGARNNRKSITAKRLIKRGEVIDLLNPYTFPYDSRNENTFGVARPGNGLPPELLLQGKKVRVVSDLEPWQTITQDDVIFLN